MGMAQPSIEVILTRELASALSTPVFLVDPDGNLLFYNEPAEPILGCRFDETGEMSVAEWATMFVPTDAEGRPLPREGLPLVIALQERRPAHARFYIKGLDGAVREIEASAFPLIGHGSRLRGGLAFFWEPRRP
jgi:PAS domain-containing protein